MREFDELSVESLPELLKKDCVLERYYPLCDKCGEIAQRLALSGIYTKYAFLEQYSEDSEAVKKRTGIDADTLLMLFRYFHLYDFKNRSLSQAECLNADLVSLLRSAGIRNSFDYLYLCR
ncbi:MAG: hypothetical protein PHI27_09365 [Eubacteriales bacterium]|nr:hypothetical protein [Eubacteriales bacterium]MDD3882449.1 hypothetical protein [Eubacteriales bacterium]MDD4513171.1 hypothetical protein [Eubacteriales bacterium]